MEEKLKEKTGRTLKQWKTVLQREGLTAHGPIMTYLKSECGVTHGYANFISLKFRQSDAASFDADSLVVQQYERKPELKPIYDKLEKLLRSLGKDVVVVPKKANVSFRRKRQFALVQPSTKTRLDLGLKFDDRDCDQRLGDSGPFGSMCTHRVMITSLDQVDGDLKRYLQEAYDEAG